MIHQLSKSRREIISNVDTLSDLAKKMNIIEGSATELLDFVAQEIKATETESTKIKIKHPPTKKK